MSEQGWRAFLAAEGVDDWVVVHGGAVAVFRVGALTQAARFAEAIANAPAIAGSGVLLTLADTRVTVRLSRDVWNLESQHIELARTVSAIAREHGAVADRACVQEVQVAIAAKPDAIDVGFWRAVLGYIPMAGDNAVDPLGHASTVWMQELGQGKSLQHAMHIDVSVAREHVKARLEAAVAAGGRIVDESHAPAHWTLADRAGNRVCICAWPDGSAAEQARNGIVIAQRIGLMSLVVDDYDDALAFFIGKLGFDLVEDTFVPEQSKRWVVVAPPGGSGTRLLLARASTEEQKSRVGAQTGGRVFLFLYTDNFWRDYERYKASGIEFVREPKREPYGMVAVFKDLYGNLWDLVEPSDANRSASV